MNPHLYSEDTERAFIGCVVQSQGAVLDTYRATPEHFFRFDTRLVFEAAEHLYANGKPVTTFTVRQRLTKEQVEQVGGDSAIIEICNSASAGMAEYLFGILNDKLTLRRTQEALAWAQAEIFTTMDSRAFCGELTSRMSGLEAESASENMVPTCISAIRKKLDRMDAGITETGYRTPLDVWDRAFGGIINGQMYALAGRPGAGKTAMMETLIDNLLSQGAPVSVFEKDMSPQKLMERLACRGVGVPFWRYAQGKLERHSTAKIRKALEVIEKQPLYVYNPAGLTAEKFCAIARRDIRTKGVKAVFLDHIQTLKVGRDMREGLTQASLTIRAHVTESNVPHIILAHLNRNGAKGRPKPEDIKEFDQLYGDCDGMALLWSEKDRADLDPGEWMDVNFYVAKNRDGDVTEDSVWFDGANLTFKNKTRE